MYFISVFNMIEQEKWKSNINVNDFDIF